MNRSPIHALVSSSLADVACDVGLDGLNLICSAVAGPGFAATWEIENRTDAIRTTLIEIQRLAEAAGYGGLRVIVEPTGIYHKLLLRLARQLGCQTAMVNAAHVSKMREVIYGDPGKTDRRDPRAIEGVARQGRVIVDRQLPEIYQLLRHWTLLYASAEASIIECKNKVHRVVKLLFPDFAFSTDFLYSESGRAVVRCFGLNPHRIAAERPRRMLTRLRKASNIRPSSIERLRTQARTSISSAPAGRMADLLERELRLVWEELELHENRRRQARQALESLYDEARLDDTQLPEPQRGVISKLALARLVGELGPFRDFSSWRQLLKMSGMNLCERKSGKYIGQTKISRTGRAGARAVLNQVALPLVKRNQLYGPYYHRKRDVEKMPGNKAMTAVARKALKMIWGLYRSTATFDRTRVFTCASEFRLAA
ncbi:MAG TPA: transposase [Thermoanaerobaculia bacterium]